MGERLFLDRCDKNFVCDWFDKEIFPNVKCVWIGSHPCDHYVLTRTFENIYLHERFKRYKTRWWKNDDNIKIITDAKYNELLEQYESEDILMEEQNISECQKCMN